MECRVLHLKYDAHNKPIIPGAHVCIKEAGQWWTVYGPPLARRLPLLAHLWEERTGLFAVFADLLLWNVIDPTNQGVSLPTYFANNTDWLSCRFDGSEMVWEPYGLTVPANLIQTYTVVSWGAEEGAVITEGQILVTIKYNQTTQTIAAPNAGRLERIMKIAGTTVIANDIVAQLEMRVRKNISKGAIRLTSKPISIPTIETPLFIGEANITVLTPSVLGSIGIGDRVSETENG